LTGGLFFESPVFYGSEISSVTTAVGMPRKRLRLTRRASGSDSAKKSSARPVQALCGTFTPTAAINFSKLTRFNTRLRL
jgi:hypothetical protein